MTRRGSSFRGIRKRWVVKAGSNIVCSGGPILVRAWMQQLARLRSEHGVEAIWVTSGAIASARAGRAWVRRGATLPQKQALSAIGQPIVMELYNRALRMSGLWGAQVLLSRDDLASPKRRANLVRTLGELLAWGVVPVLNENDAVATEEIRFGDNDTLSALVARVMGADRLVLLTDVEGCYDADPRRDPSARLLHELRGVPGRILARAGARGSSNGTGGMASKLKAAREATRHGVETWIVRGDAAGVLTRVAGDEKIGTRVFCK